MKRTLINGECLEEMDKLIEQGVVVDAIICDPPYGTTACKWDSIIPLEPMWEQLKRLIKSNGAIVMTASQPFTTTLIGSNIKNCEVIMDAMKEYLKPLEICYVEILNRDFQKINEVSIGDTVILLEVKVGETRLLDNLWL